MRSLLGALLAAAAAVAVVGTIALWAPTLGAPTDALDTAEFGDSGPVAAVVPTLAPEVAADDPTADSAAAAASSTQVSAARTFAGNQLAGNAGLTLSATARELLVAGQVDARGILSLGQYLGQTQLAVADFPAVDAALGAGEIRRQILVSGLAGVPVGTDATGSDAAVSEAATASVETWFEALSAPVNVESAVRTAAGVLVTFAPGEPSSMLPTPPPSL